MENDIPVQEKSQRKSDHKGHHESHDMRTDGKAAAHQASQVQHLFVEDEIVGYEIDENIQGGIAAATGDIPESLQRNEPPERRVKKVDDRCYGSY